MNEQSAHFRGLLVRLAALVVLAGSGLCVGLAENIDPGGDQHQYAWSENAGWINAQPLGPGGLGMEIGDFRVTGWLWAENLGWINLNCRNRNTCDAAVWGVRNDGHGNLAGFAWAENGGWIDFAPTGGGVRVIAHGTYQSVEGWAYGENIGWIHFIPGGTGEYGIRTSWNCLTGVPLVGSPALTVLGGNATRLEWTAIPGATAYDVVRGRLDALLASRSFASAGITCISSRQSATNLENAATHETPAPGSALFYLIRGVRCDQVGTYQDDRPSPPGPRDAEIAASGGDCG